MYLIRQLAAKYNLTRTALLHYDAIGLLSPSVRTEAGYRLYSGEDEQRLQNILLFRSMGISLETIGQLLGNDESRLANALLRQLDGLNREIEVLRDRQRSIINLFKDIKTLDKFLSRGNYDQETQNLFDDIDLVEWHQKFDAISPELHEEFLEILDLISESVKESIQVSLNAIPEEDRNELDKIIHRK